MPQIDQLLIELKEAGASDLHLVVGQPPKVRVHGHLENLGSHSVFTEESLGALLGEISTASDWEHFKKNNDLDFAYGLEGVARYRCNYFRQIIGMGAVFRIIPEKILTLDELGMPPVLKRLADLRSGMVLVTGPTGSGKSTTLAAMIDYINTTRACRLLTIEDPIEFVHPNKKSIILQREVGAQTRSFAHALHSATREDIDVILVGEMRDLETISNALTAAEMGSLVFGTLHTNNAPKTVDRVIDAFPADQQEQVRTMLAESLQGVVSQLLLRTADNRGRIAVNEIMTASPALASMIRQGQVEKITSYIQAGRGEGMQLMDDAIYKLLKEGKITPQEAYLKAQEKSRFESALGDRLPV
ncbi:MAG: type IV pilus twitching motility protein PilT [Planctomycetota bacterium]|nr:type IV pilus twitching motility protein PilT [Planctomycetota bacterium]MDA1141360.1 type IV pilus twitching motility protein PilT [Planctomycetota bacterium]